MASDNETVAQVCEVLYAYPKAEVCDGNGLTVLNNDKIADRILASHRREKCELAAFVTKQKAINKDLVDEIESLKTNIAIRNAERKGLLKSNESLAADNTRLRGEVAELRKCLSKALTHVCRSGR